MFRFLNPELPELLNFQNLGCYSVRMGLDSPYVAVCLLAAAVLAVAGVRVRRRAGVVVAWTEICGGRVRMIRIRRRGTRPE